ncbi:unnamed protein product [Ceratitis capitata]|uniref:(Mediterranean fruit fly) hypothetical protein n=1 Tax=Ceratitis capitata TaxID=7213 RepID=A0A811URX9_CERCA|nr:unnamed protein product [Ceratitis capitata]
MDVDPGTSCSRQNPRIRSNISERFNHPQIYQQGSISNRPNPNQGRSRQQQQFHRLYANNAFNQALLQRQHVNNFTQHQQQYKRPYTNNTSTQAPVQKLQRINAMRNEPYFTEMHECEDPFLNEPPYSEMGDTEVPVLKFFFLKGHRQHNLPPSQPSKRTPNIPNRMPFYPEVSFQNPNLYNRPINNVPNAYNRPTNSLQQNAFRQQQSFPSANRNFQPRFQTHQPFQPNFPPPRPMAPKP